MNLEEIVKKRLGKRSPRQVIGELIEINILDLPENDKGQSILEEKIITQVNRPTHKGMGMKARK